MRSVRSPRSPPRSRQTACYTRTRWIRSFQAITQLISLLPSPDMPCLYVCGATPLLSSQQLNYFMKDRGLPRPLRMLLREYFSSARRVHQLNTDIGLLEKMSPLLQGNGACACTLALFHSPRMQLVHTLSSPQTLLVSHSPHTLKPSHCTQSRSSRTRDGWITSGSSTALARRTKAASSSPLWRTSSCDGHTSRMSVYLWGICTSYAEASSSSSGAS